MLVGLAVVPAGEEGHWICCMVHVVAAHTKKLRIKNFIKIKWRRSVIVCNTNDLCAIEKSMIYLHQDDHLLNGMAPDAGKGHGRGL